MAFALNPAGKLIILPALSKFNANSTYQSFSDSAKNALKAKWNSQVSASLAKLPPLYHFALNKPEADQDTAGTLPQATKDAIADLLKVSGDWAAAKIAYNKFQHCPDHPDSCSGRQAFSGALRSLVSLIVNQDFLNSTPLSNVQLEDKIAYFVVDDLLHDFKTQVKIAIKAAPPGLQPAFTPISADWVLDWLTSEWKGKVWVAGEIRQRLMDTILAMGLQPDVGVSRGDAPAVTIDEALIHLIRMPGVLDPAKPEDARELLKILSILLPEEEYSAAGKKLSSLLTLVGAGSLSYQQLDLSQLRGKAGLPYLDLFEFPAQQAKMQEAGYVVNTQAETAGDTNFATPWILYVSKPDNTAPSKAPGAPDAKTRGEQGSKTPVSTAGGAEKLPPLAGKPVTPAVPSAPPAPLSVPHFTFGAGLQYRSGEGIRPLVSGSTNALTAPWGVTNIAATAGAENTNPVGGLAWNNDYIAFGKLHHRLSFDLSGKTDSTANRLLGSASETDVRRTGGQGRIEYDALTDWHGLYVEFFGQGARDTLSFSRAGAAIPNDKLWTADAGATIDAIHEARRLPGRFEFTPQIHFGASTAALAKPYRVASFDFSAHQRISDIKRVSLDISGHFRDASKGTPIFELPSLGGGDTLRGFRTDDILARRYWSLQNELWTPVPGTLSALPGGSGAMAVRRFLQESIRLAFFADVGGAYQMPTSVPPEYLTGASQAVLKPGIRWAPGLGIRFIRGNFALKLDWSYGQGRGQSGAGHGRADLGVVQNGAF